MPKVAISSDFLTAYAKIPRSQQKKVREFITRFQDNPTSHSINYEPIHDVKDDRVRTVRIDLAYRAIILHPDQGDVYLLVWVDHHDEAIDWARNKVFEVNPITGSLQVLDTEDLESIDFSVDQAQDHRSLDEYRLFETFTDEELLKTGLPSQLLPAIRKLEKPEDLDALQNYLPAEAFESLYWVVNLGYSIDQAIQEAGIKSFAAEVDPSNLEEALTRPDSLRRFAIIDTPDELIEILNAPLDKWRTFLHPSQSYIVQGDFSGPFRVLGGAGTGKTVVAMHRAKHLAKSIFNQRADRVLFTTYTRNLANNIEELLSSLCGSEFQRIEVVNLHRWAVNFLHTQRVHIDIASDTEIEQCWRDVFSSLGSGAWDEAFIRGEWKYVVQQQGISTKQGYLRASRKGRRIPTTRSQRATVWEFLDKYKQNLSAINKMEWVDLIRETRLYLAHNNISLPYRSIVVDEAQDMHPEELKLIRQMVPEGPNDLFLVGDAHQRIYGIPVVFSHCGIEIRGRARKLRINYRTTEEIRDWSMLILDEQYIDDLDGGLDEHLGYRSLMHGVPPIIKVFDTLEEEQTYLLETIGDLTNGSPADSICVVARTHRQIEEKYLPALREANINYLYLKANTPDNAGTGVRLATMHRVKGLEFQAIIIVGANDEYLPLKTRYKDETYEKEDELLERCLLHVASTRARDKLYISSYGEASRFII
jgi:hypothetical protein